jgi:hypothetical protein
MNTNEKLAQYMSTNPSHAAKSSCIQLNVLEVLPGSIISATTTDNAIKQTIMLVINKLDLFAS